MSVYRIIGPLVINDIVQRLIYHLQVYMKGNVGKWQVNFGRDKTTDSSIITMGLPKRAGQNGNLRIDSDLIGDKVIIYPD